ncbi:MAG: DUF4258 domain-containing protein [Deltaproteobacteria bacterium]|nr:DUF4258 domain-containing protein [Deltaproteobacteria bacterium]
MQFSLTNHASEMLEIRSIEREWIARVLEKPILLEADQSDPSLMHALGHIPEFGDRVLRVIYNKRCTPWLVVTAYFDRTQRGKI